MALVNGKENHLYTTYQEATAGTPLTAGRFEMFGEMALPQPTYMIEQDRGKLGTGQHGTKQELQSLYTPYSYTMAQRLSEFAYWLYFLMGRADNVNLVDTGVYNHQGKLKQITELTMPTFTMQYGNGTNDVIAGCVVNDCSITIPFVGGNGVWETTFNGWGTKHSVVDGTITKLSSGSISSASEGVSSEPLLNGKCCSAWIGDSLEASFGQTSVDFAGADLLNAVEITSLVNSITITINNGMTGEDKMRGGGCGIINDYTRGLPAITLSMNLRKDVSIADWHSYIVADTKKAVEILFSGPEISTGYNYALDLFFPVTQINSATEDRETPISGDVEYSVFEDSNNDAFIAYVQSAVDEGYNATA